MFTPEQMQQIQVVFSRRDVEAVAEVIVRLGTLQVVDTVEMEEWAGTLEKGGTGEESDTLRQRRDRVETLIQKLRLPNSIGNLQLDTQPWEIIDEKLDALLRQVREEETTRDQYEKEMDRLREIRRRIDETSVVDFPLENRDAYSYLAVETGRVTDENLEILKKRLEGVLHVLTPLNSLGGMTTLIVITLRRDKAKLEQALAESAFERLDYEHAGPAVSPEVLKDADRQIEGYESKLAEAQSRLDEIGQKQDDFLRRELFRVRREVLKQQILKYFRKTEHTFLLSGWLPSANLQAMVVELKRATKNRCVIETTLAEKVASVRSGQLEVPVHMKNPKLIEPFELITSTYGMPAYHTIDPTPLVALSFVLMFGVMFGDVGHGAILAIIGFLLSFRTQSQMKRQAGTILMYAGFSSIVFGFLFGSIFGVENFLPTLWLKPMDSIPRLFKTAIYFGMGMIFMSITINVINGILRRDILHVLLDKAGLVAAVLYWCGIVVATRVVSSNPTVHKEVPVLVPILMIVAVLLLFFREPIILLAEGKKTLYPEGVGTGFIGGFMEVFEILLGFLTNTISFIRVAAFGLAHAGLFMAIFSLSDMVGGVGSVFVHLFGNILIIGLEGMVVTIQVMRLEFYEFFGRFFKEGTAVYKPVRVETGVNV